MRVIFILCMCLGPVGLAELSQPESTNNERDKEISLLLELHQNFCGEDFLCKNDSSYWKPRGTMMLTPCCVPCSCLPTCGDQMDCCPAFWMNEVLDDKRLGVRETPNEQMTNQGDITDDIIARAEDNPDESDEIIEDSGPNKLSSFPNCIRPQAIYDPNRFLDSEAYEMITNCPEWFKDVATIEKCHAGMDNENLLDIIPVTSTLTGMTYANEYCAHCNGISANATSKFRDWKPTLVGYGMYLRHRRFLLPEMIIEEMRTVINGFQNIHFIPDKATVPVKCNTYDIQLCNQTGLLYVFNETLMNSCQNGPALPIIQRVGAKKYLFKNVACLHCNMDKDFSGNPNQCGYYESLSFANYTKYSISFNLRSTANDDQTESSTPVRYLGESSLRLLKQGRCSPGYAALQGACREVICPRHHYLRKNQCVPLFDTLSGLDLHVKIQVTPDRVIMKDVAAEFEGKLTEMVYYIMKQTVSLQVRDIFVMFLPNKQRTGKIYYVFYIYLYNSTGNIKFSQAITETKDFVSEMKTQASLTLSDKTKIGLKVGFAHKIRIAVRSFIDLSNGEALVLMKKTAWGQRIQRPDLEISDVHWCYRTEFTLPDIKPIRDGVIEILVIPSVIVYENEIEHIISKHIISKHKIYVCIDLVVTPITGEDVSPTRTTEGKVDTVEGEANGVLDDKGGALVVTCVVLAVFGIIFYKVRVHLLAAKRKMNTDMLANQSAIGLDTINGKSKQRKVNVIDEVESNQNDDTPI